jgi:SET domain-containing protein
LLVCHLLRSGILRSHPYRMLMIPARAQRSAIHGQGLFADRDIAAGELIWAFHPAFDLVIDEATNASFPDHTQAYVQRYATFTAASKSFQLSSDDDRYTNHSDAPNTHVIEQSVFARVAIPAGEEITADYREIGMLWVP